MKLKKINFLLLALVASIFLPSVWAKPGNERVLRSKTQSGQVYLVEAQEYEKGVYQAKLVWLPEDLTELCEGRDLQTCTKIDHCLQYPTERVCDPQATKCREFPSEKCLRLGIKKSQLVKRAENTMPFRLVSTWKRIWPHEKRSFEQVVGKLKLEKKKRVKFPVTKKHLLKASFKWEHWTNGFNFKVLNFNQDQ